MIRHDAAISPDLDSRAAARVTHDGIKSDRSDKKHCGE
jgi:hypothetical protein